MIQTPLVHQSPALPPLPPSEISGNSGPPQIMSHSSARTPRGPPHLDDLDVNGAPPAQAARSRRISVGTRSRASWADSDGKELVAELTVLAEATCSRCGRVFSGKDTLQKHRTYSDIYN